MVGLKRFYQNLLNCLFVIIVIRSYFSYISLGSVQGEPKKDLFER